MKRHRVRRAPVAGADRFTTGAETAGAAHRADGDRTDRTSTATVTDSWGNDQGVDPAANPVLTV